MMGPARAQLWRKQHGPHLLVQEGLGVGLGSHVAWGGQSSPHLQMEV